MHPDVEIYERAWSVARDLAAAATKEWASATGDPLAGVIALATAADRSAESFDDAHEAVAELTLAGRSPDDLGLTEEQRILRQSLRAFSEREVRPVAREIHRGDGDIPRGLIEKVADLGLFAFSVPEVYGGALGDRPDHVAMLIGTEELSAGSLAAAGSLMTRPEILVRSLLSGGSEAQRSRWLPAIASGRSLVAVAVTEPNAGSDVAQVQCRAERLPDGRWKVTGTKLWCTFAGRAHLVMLLCRTGTRESGHRGLSLFVVEKESFDGRGFDVRQPGGGRMTGKAIPTIGYRGLHTFELVFDGFVLPADALVGAEGRGFYLQLEGFATGRLQTAARAVGVMHAATRDALAYATGRKAFGTTVAKMPLARAMLGRMVARLHASRQLSYWAARLIDAGTGQEQASLAKLYASRMAEYVTRDAMQLFGAMGYGEETDVSRYFIDARVLAIFEGAEEVLALKVIGPSLDLPPREARR